MKNLSSTVVNTGVPWTWQNVRISLQGKHRDGQDRVIVKKIRELERHDRISRIVIPPE